MNSSPLSGKVALVTGATRGAGRGIAQMLGEAGATVYCTGRSSRTDAKRRAASKPGRPFAVESRPETIEETAELVTKAGGRGIPIAADHTKPEDVAAVADHVWKESGRLDILVNDIWGGDDAIEWGRPFWELDADQGLAVVDRVMHTHIQTSRNLLPRIIQSRYPALIVEITDGDFLGYRGNFYYDMAKIIPLRTAYALACDLDEKGIGNITSLAVTPGFLRSEAMLDHFGVTEADWQKAVTVNPHFSESETPCFVGRAVAALAADAHVHRKAGGVFASWTLALEYNFSDIDGRRPNFGRYFKGAVDKVLAKGLPCSAEDRALVNAWHRHNEFDPTYSQALEETREFLRASAPKGSA